MFDFSDYYDRIARDMPNGCRVCEVGVADGDSAIYLAKKLNEYGKSFKLYMVDNMDYGKYLQMKTIYENIIKSGLGEFIEVVPYDSIEASKLFNDGFLHFCYIDSSHLYQETRDSIIAWYPKVLDEFIMAGHDYFGHEEVRKAVDEIIPKTTIADLRPGGRPNETIQVLHTENTDEGYGLWWMQKQHFIPIK